MDWLTFTATVIEALAWPLAVVLLVLVLRTPIKGLLPLLQRFKYKEFELEFGKQVGEISEEVAREISEKRVLALPPDESSASVRLAEVSPRSAVLEAWREVELAALDAAKAIGGESIQNRTFTYQTIRLLEQNESLDRNLISLLRDLRGLRNLAVHAPDFVLTKEAALEYAGSASVVSRYLKKVTWRLA